MSAKGDLSQGGSQPREILVGEDAYNTVLNSILRGSPRDDISAGEMSVSEDAYNIVLKFFEHPLIVNRLESVRPVGSRQVED